MGSAPGYPAQIMHICELGSFVVSFGQEQNILLFVVSWTCTSMPMVVSYSGYFSSIDLFSVMGGPLGVKNFRPRSLRINSGKLFVALVLSLSKDLSALSFNKFRTSANKKYHDLRRGRYYKLLYYFFSILYLSVVSSLLLKRVILPLKLSSNFKIALYSIDVK